MRHLYILRGVPGVGKSTLIDKYNLGQFTLSADDIRQKYANTDYVIEYDENNKPSVKETINSRKESTVWETLKEMLEARMERGETTIIDATHTNTRALRNYNKLVKKYRYRVFTIQVNKPLDVILEQNRQRPDAKRLPDEEVIKKFNDLEYSTPNVANQYGLHQFDNIDDAGEFILTNSTWRAKEIKPEEYNKVYLIGDLHASYEVLEEFLNNYYDEDSFYVFHGDYLDRGLTPYETVKALHKLHKKKNVVLLRGNHETNYESWLQIPDKYTEETIKMNRISDKKVKENLDDIKNYTKLTRSSNKYIKELKAKVTEKEFADFTSKLKDILRKIQDIFMFTVNGQTYLSTHGGIVYNAIDFNNTGSMINLSADNMVRGVGTYDDDIDVIFNQQVIELPEEERLIQVHGHRNTFELGILDNPYSYNLEQGITDGGDFGVLEIDVKTGNTKDISIKNNHYRMTLRNTDLSVYPISKLYEDMKGNDYIRVKPLKTVEGVSSINITPDAFYEKVWNGFTVRARGLFVNPEEEKVVARSYNKFFNLNERRNTKLNNFEENVTLPVTVSSKVNGFLGILTVYRDEFLFLSKSTDGSQFSKLFKDTFLDHANELGINLEELKGFIEREDVSLVFEVIDNDKDPHIIRYQNKGVVLLDVFKNQLVEETLGKHDIPELEKFIKPVEFVINDYDELKQYVNNFNKGIDIRTSPELENVGEKIDKYNEGVILTDANKHRIKVKGAFYNTWKSIRPIIYKRLAGNRGNARSRFGQEFLQFIIDHRQDTLTNSVLIERDEFVKQYNKNNNK